MERSRGVGRVEPALFWEDLGDIRRGRGELGEEMPVMIYRLMQYAMRDVLTAAYGKKEAEATIRRVGRLAGREFAAHRMNLSADFSGFLAEFQRQMRELKIGILRVEQLDESTGELTLTVAEDLGCSGLPATGETVCNYEEGFIAGVLSAYTKTPYSAREIDCWATGNRVCRFQCAAKEPLAAR